MGFPRARIDSADLRITMKNCYNELLCASMMSPQTKKTSTDQAVFDSQACLQGQIESQM